MGKGLESRDNLNPHGLLARLAEEQPRVAGAASVSKNAFEKFIAGAQLARYFAPV